MFPRILKSTGSQILREEYFICITVQEREMRWLLQSVLTDRIQGSRVWFVSFSYLSYVWVLFQNKYLRSWPSLYVALKYLNMCFKSCIPVTPMFVLTQDVQHLLLLFTQHWLLVFDLISFSSWIW